MAMPEFISPMTATLVHDYFSDKEWIFERKFDGIRCIARKENNQVTLYSRNRKKLNERFPEIVDAMKKQKGNFILDGEIVTFDNKVTSFEKLQPRIQKKKPSKDQIKKVPVFYYVFDILFAHGEDLRKKTLEKRKKALKKEIQFTKRLKYTRHFNKEGEKRLKEACKKNWEGLIAKKKSSVYKSKRSKLWLKFKCSKGQEFVIGGYTDPKGSRIGFGAILIGYYKKNTLHYAGKIGTGFDDKTLKDLHKKMKKYKTEKNPFKEKIQKKNVHFVKPKIVIEAEFTEWTKDHKLRHPRYKGLRIDKKPKEVTIEK